MKPAETLPTHRIAAPTGSASGPGRSRFVAVLFAAVALVLTAPPPAAGADPSPRFVLFNAEYNSSLKQVSKTTVFLEKRLFKLDTQTGETWVLIDVLQDGRDIRYWQKITDTPQK